MENNRSKFESHGYIINSIAEKLEIQISQSGDAACYQSTIRWSSRGTEVIHSLWAHDEQKQIDKMRELYDLLPIKPEWLTREQIDAYAAQMGAK